MAGKGTSLEAQDGDERVADRCAHRRIRCTRSDHVLDGAGLYATRGAKGGGTSRRVEALYRRMGDLATMIQLDNTPVGQDREGHPARSAHALDWQLQRDAWTMADTGNGFKLGRRTTGGDYGKGEMSETGKSKKEGKGKESSDAQAEWYVVRLPPMSLFPPPPSSSGGLVLRQAYGLAELALYHVILTLSRGSGQHLADCRDESIERATLFNSWVATVCCFRISRTHNLHLSVLRAG